MAEINTPNLNKFQNQFDQAVNDGRETEVKINKQGEPVLIRGRGTSGKGKTWLALRHPDVYKQGKNPLQRHRLVVDLLKSSAEKDFGEHGPKLIQSYMRQHGLRDTDKLTSRDVHGAIDFAKKMEKLESLYETLNDTTCRNMFEDYLSGHGGLEKLMFDEDRDTIDRFVLQDRRDHDYQNHRDNLAKPKLVQTAFRLFAERNGLKFEELDNFLDDKKPVTRNSLRKFERRLDDYHRGLYHAFDLDKKLDGLRKDLANGNVPEDRSGQGHDAPRDNYLFHNRQVPRLTEKMIEDDIFRDVKAVLRKAPQIKQRVDELTTKELIQINDLYSDDSELTAINKAKQFLAKKKK